MGTSIGNNNYNSPTVQHIFILYQYVTFAFYRNRFNILSFNTVLSRMVYTFIFGYIHFTEDNDDGYKS